jgi:phosphohistidine phosphatase
LRLIVPAVELVLSSPYTRAWQTAAILREEAGWPAPERCEVLEAVHSAAEAAEQLAVRRASASVALVGHEPQLSSLASLLLARDEHAFELELKKGGVVCLTVAGEPAPGRAFLRWSVSPKILRSLAG